MPSFSFIFKSTKSSPSLPGQRRVGAGLWGFNPGQFVLILVGGVASQMEKHPWKSWQPKSPEIHHLVWKGRLNIFQTLMSFVLVCRGDHFLVGGTEIFKIFFWRGWWGVLKAFQFLMEVWGFKGVLNSKTLFAISQHSHKFCGPFVSVVHFPLENSRATVQPTWKSPNGNGKKSSSNNFPKFRIFFPSFWSFCWRTGRCAVPLPVKPRRLCGRCAAIGFCQKKTGVRPDSAIKQKPWLVSWYRGWNP